MNGLDLFSGIGGLSLALDPWVNVIAYCENNKYAQSVLLSRMVDGQLQSAPIWDDIASFGRSVLPREPIDIIFGGPPCQDYSIAGRQKGMAGKRARLSSEFMRVVGEFMPEFVFMENVPAIIGRGFERLLTEISLLGYDCRWTIVSAKEVGAPHIRKRFWLLAHNNKFGSETRKRQAEICRWKSIAGTSGEFMDNADKRRQGVSKKEIRSRWNGAFDSGWWETEPDVDRVVNGFPHRVDRIECLGNAVVPLQAREAFKFLMGSQ